MYTGLYTAVAGSIAQENRLNVITNNLANATTVGFKADKSVFHAMLVQTVVGEVQPPDRPQPVVAPIDPLRDRYTPSHPQLSTYTDFSQGSLHETGNRLDVALMGKGFFVVAGADSEAMYTRQGTFSMNTDGLLVTQQGLAVQGEGGPIRVRGSHVDIDAAGRVLVDGNFVDRLKLVDFPQPAALEKVGDTLFRASGSDAQIQGATDITVHQGTVELTNSSIVRLLGEVIQTSRTYEVYQRMIQAFDDTAGRAVNDIAKA